MGIFDEIKRAVDAATKPARGAPPPAQRSRAAASAPNPLTDAHKRRRQVGVTRANGKPATERKMRNYERLERALVLEGVGYPFDSARVRQALSARGFRADAVEAYLRSDAARKLLE